MERKQIGEEEYPRSSALEFPTSKHEVKIQRKKTQWPVVPYYFLFFFLSYIFSPTLSWIWQKSRGRKQSKTETEINRERQPLLHKTVESKAVRFWEGKEQDNVGEIKK